MENIGLNFILLVMGLHLIISVVVSITLSLTFIGEGFTKFYVIKSLVIEAISFFSMIFIDKITEIGLNNWLVMIVFGQLIVCIIVAVIKNSEDNAMKMVFILVTVQELFSIVVFFLYFLHNTGLESII